MNLITKVTIPKSTNTITYNSKLVLLGSCFSENMGSKFEYLKFQSAINPFGIIFNPISNENLIRRAVLDFKFSEKDIFFHDGFWKCYEVHSHLNLENKIEYLSYLNQLVHDFKIKITQASHVLITYGTSWVYRHSTSNRIVANCHKVAQNQFTKELLSIETIEKAIQNSVNLISSINSSCTFIFTISPVRHLKDGFVENQISKAHLIAAVHKFKLQNCTYFPSYEIMMDELRDYRFYADDLLHPSQTAINYIWERFSETYFTNQTLAIAHEIDTIQKALAHRPVNINSEKHQQFLANLEAKKIKLSADYPQINF